MTPVSGMPRGGRVVECAKHMGHGGTRWDEPALAAPGVADRRDARLRGGVALGQRACLPASEAGGTGQPGQPRGLRAPAGRIAARDGPGCGGRRCELGACEDVRPVGAAVGTAPPPGCDVGVVACAHHVVGEPTHPSGPARPGRLRLPGAPRGPGLDERPRQLVLGAAELAARGGDPRHDPVVPLAPGAHRPPLRDIGGRDLGESHATGAGPSAHADRESTPVRGQVPVGAPVDVPERAGYVPCRDLLPREPLGQRMAQGAGRLVVARGPDAGAARTPYEYVGVVRLAVAPNASRGATWRTSGCGHVAAFGRPPRR